MKQEGWDRLGIGVSGVCMVHCLLLPVVISALPMWSSAQAVHGWLHPVFAILLVPTTIFALVTGFRRHRSNRVVWLMTIGLLLVVTAAFPALHAPGVIYETLLTILGSVFLISGHFLNWRYGRKCLVEARVDRSSDLSEEHIVQSATDYRIESEDLTRATT